MTDTVAAVLATLVAIGFALCTFERYLARRAPYELAWSLALVLFAVASAALAIGVSAGWSGAAYRVFFCFGAIINVPVLALGTVYLLAGRRAGTIASIIVGLAAAFAAGVLASIRFTHPLPRHSLPQGSQVLPGVARLFAGIGSGLGATVIIAGAIYSAVRLRRGNLMWANLLIALGTIVTGASGLANSAFDQATAFSVALGAGITIIFVGFLFSSPPQIAAAARETASPLR
jgi:hypothetical protein